MAKKAQVIIISLWILVILTFLAVSIGHRVSMALRLARYQRDRLKAFYLARAGLNRAIIELQKDTNNYDALNESWASNEDVFGKIRLSDNQNEFAAVSHDIIDQNNQIKTIYGIIDEERKIGINTATQELLVALLEGSGISAATEITNNILIWRGDIPDDNKIYDSLGYPCKADKFSNIEELALVKGITSEDYQKLAKLITVHGIGAININTVSAEVLRVFARGIAKSISKNLPITENFENFADSVATEIIDLRNRKGYFEDNRDVDIAIMGDEETNIFNNLMGSVVFRSDNFLIEVNGNISKIKSRVRAVYNRRDKKFLYWHES